MRTVLLDKTGTLTEGRPSLAELRVFGRHDESRVLRLAAALEQSSTHPIAAAIVAAAGDSNDAGAETVEDFQSETGFGVCGRVANQIVRLGKLEFMRAAGAEMEEMNRVAERYAAAGMTPVLMTIDEVPAAVFGVSDVVKPESNLMVETLRKDGIMVVMVTGDHALAAAVVAGQVGIDSVRAGVRPDGKGHLVEEYQAGGEVVCFVGDGINDAPALAQADVGIAIGTGADVAVESADVVLMSGDPSKIPVAIRLSKATLRNIRQNLFWAFAYNTALIPVAAGILYPAFGILLSPVLAATAMAASSLCVLANALRLKRFRPEHP